MLASQRLISYSINNASALKWAAFMLLAGAPTAFCKDEKTAASENIQDKFNRLKDVFDKEKTKDPLQGLQDFVINEVKDGSLTPVKELFETGLPGQVGYGFLMGYSSGFCLKKMSKFVAFVLGGTFIFIQSLSYSGYIKVDYDGIQKDAEKILDLNKDGKVDINDAKFAQSKVSEILGYQMPAGGGFAAGLLMGLRG